jgi:DNA replication protein
MTRVPAQFFSELLGQIDDLGELKVTLYTLWAVERMEGAVRYLSLQDYAGDAELLKGLGGDVQLRDALERAVLRGTLLRARLGEGEATAELYFLNSARGRAAVDTLQRGAWRPEAAHAVAQLEVERPNIFRLYEQNIGPLTPLIGEALQDAEKDYPAEWIAEAFQIAVERNARNWKYIEAILKRWQEEGRDQSNRRDAAKDRRKYIEGEFADFIEH